MGSLRTDGIRLAYLRADLRPHLLPLLTRVGKTITPLPDSAAEALPDEVLAVIHKYRDMVAKGVCPRVYEKFREYHPLAGQCRGLAVGLAREVDAVLGGNRARVVGGWFRHTGKDYYFPTDYVSYPPRDLVQEGERWSEHWWVELDGYYLDVSADQFFPSDVGEQEAHQVVVSPKSEGKYHPYRRRPVHPSKPLSPKLEILAEKIVSMKQSRRWDADRAETWLRINAKKYGLDDAEVADLAATLRHESSRVDMTQVESVRDWLREVA